ncbi:TPA-induced transmembrane protein isoform X2 [Pyxicephalus adspersus]|uniref:TPA-induced transmembrane protein isoform X2 n=1 Tax=Pyxicephalus adspersus TaxID=30357 RepID=UPI003B5B4143
MASEENNHSVQSKILLPNNQENASKRHKKTFFKKPKVWIAIIFVLFVLVTIISLVLYSNVYEDDDEKHFRSSSTNKTCTFTGILNLSDPCLLNSWIKNENTFQDRIVSLYAKAPSLQYYFIGANIEYDPTNENQSAIIQLEFASPSKAFEYFISTELVEGILRQDIYDPDYSACQHSNTLFDAFQVTLSRFVSITD